MSGWPDATREYQRFAAVVATIARERLARFVDIVEAEDRLVDEVLSVLVDNDLWSPELARDEKDKIDLTAAVVAVTELAAVLPSAALALANLQLAGIASFGSASLDEAVRSARPLAVIDTGELMDGPDSGVCIVGRRSEFLDGASGLILLAGERVLWLSAEEICRGELSPVLGQTGLRGAASRRLTLGTPSDSHAELSTNADELRVYRALLLSALGAGLARAATTDAATYAHERHQFGRVIAEIPAIAVKLRAAEDRSTMMTRELVTAARRARADGPKRASSTVATGARRIQLELVPHVNHCLQVLGGYGYLVDYSLARLTRDAISTQALIAGALSHLDRQPVAAA